MAIQDFGCDLVTGESATATVEEIEEEEVIEEDIKMDEAYVPTLFE